MIPPPPLLLLLCRAGATHLGAVDVVLTVRSATQTVKIVTEKRIFFFFLSKGINTATNTNIFQNHTNTI